MSFSSFLSSGLCVVPLRKGVPQVEWSRFYNSKPSMDEAQGWDDAGHKEYALLCGEVSGVVALDIDTDDTSLSTVFYALAGHSPLRKLGSKGFTTFYRYNGESSQSWGGVVELLSNKRLTTIPPSPHRKTGIPYVWMDGQDTGDFSDLPFLNPDLITFLDAKYPKKRHQTYAVPANYHHESVDLSQAAEMLDHISPDCGRDDWIQVGMALRDEFGDAACHLWHSWSAKAPNRYNHNDAQAAWRSFGGSGVTIGTLVYLAKQGGWMPRPTDVSGEGFSVDLSYLDRPSIAPAAPIVIDGLVGRIADWITSTAIFPQPMLSLAASLTFVGMVRGHRVRGYTDLRTNILTLSLAPTAAGKEHPQNCIKRLASACGLEKHMMGEPVSGGGFLTGLNKGGRVSLLVMDEMGRYIANLSGKQAGTHQREIIDYIIKTFSCANSMLKGRQYVDEKKNPTIDIVQPHFCCLGSTVQERMQQACSSSEVIDGFLNRWLVFNSKIRPPRAEKVRFSPPPEDIVSEVTHYLAANNPYNQYGEPEPKEVRFTPEAWDFFCDYRRAMDAKVAKSDYPMDRLYSRCCEHVEKLSLIICDGDAIYISDLKAAIAIVEQSSASVMEFAGMIADNQTEADYIRVREMIKEAGTMRRNVLTRRTQFLIGGDKRRIEIMAALIEDGLVSWETVGKTTTYSWVGSE